MHSNNVRSKAAKQNRSVPAAGWRPDIEVVFLLGIVVAALLIVSPAMAQDGEAQIRMAHLSPDAPSVMVELDGEPVEDLANVSYKDSTPYLPIPAGPHELAVFAVADPSEPVLEVSISPEADASYTVAGVGLIEDGTFGARLFEDDLSDPDEGEARLRVIHTIPDVGPATVGVQDGPDLFALPGFANASDYADVEAGTYTLEVTPSGAPEPAFDVPDVEVEEGEVYTAFAIGQASEGTIGTMLTVDSDNGRLVGPTTLEDTSGDLSLLENPQPERASSSIAPKKEPKAPNNDGGETSPEAPKKEPNKPSSEAPEEPAPAQNVEPEAAEDGSSSAGSAPVETIPAEAAPAEAAPVEAAPVEAAPVEAAPVEAAPVETFEAPVEAAPVETAPVETVPAPVEAAPIYTPTYTPPPPVVPPAVVEEIVAEAVAPDTGYVPQPAPVATAVPQLPIPEIPIPVVPIPVVPIPEISIPVVPVPSVEVPPVPTVSWSSQAEVSTQAVTSSGAVASGFVPPVPIPDIQAPVGGEVIGTVIGTPAVVNSGARRKFVTMKKGGSSGA